VTGTVLSRLGAVAAMTTVIAASIVTGSAAAAQDVGVASHRTWACSVPAGYTWSSVRANSNCGGYEYFLLDAVNVNLTGTWACAIPGNYTYTASRQGSNCAASPGASPWEYRLARI
jgi:hypothetical protein